MNKRLAALIMAGMITATIMPWEAEASQLVNNSGIYMTGEDIEYTYAEGEYIVKNETLKEDSDADSAARKYVNPESVIHIGEEIWATLEFNNKSLMTNITVKVNGESREILKSEEEGNLLRIYIPLESVNDKIEVNSTISLPFMKMNVTFRVNLDTSEIPMIPVKEPEEDKKEEDGGEGKPEVKPETKPEVKPDPVPEVKPDIKPEIPEDTVTDKAPVTNPVTENSQSSIYKIKNNIITDSAMGYSAARAAVGSTCYLEKTENTYYVTLGLSQLNVMENIRVYVDGTLISYETVYKNDTNNTMDIRFPISSISSSISVSSYITMAGMDISFGIDLLEDSMELISEAQKNEVLSVPSAPIVSDIATETLKEETVLSEVELTDSIEAKEYFKRYTIENEIISDSMMGKTMTRKYLDSTSILEEIDGKFYLTVSFKGTSAMNNIRFTVNGEEALCEIVSENTESGTKAFRFEISSLDDEIMANMHIVPVNMDISFGIGLLKDTMTLVDEGVISEETEGSQVVIDNLLSSQTKETTNVKRIVTVTAAVTTAIVLVLEVIAVFTIKKIKKNKEIK